MDESVRDAEWEDWLNSHAPQFLLFARQQARSEADAQDLVQEAIVEAAHRHRAGVPPVPLVFATIRRRAIDLARSEDRRTGREQVAVPPLDEPWFDTTVNDRERAQIVQQALSRLPDSYREVITLKVWGGLTFAQLAEALQIPANTAASRYRYGLEELRKLTRGVLV